MRILIVIAPTVLAIRREKIHAVVAAHRSVSCDFCEVRGRDDISLVAKRARDGYDRILAMGGDGTVGAVCQALEGTSIPMGILAAGTGNLVARELGIPLDLAEAFELAIRPDANITRIDAMRIKSRLFLLNVGVGVNAEAARQTTRTGKTLLGRSAYVFSAISRVICSKRYPMEIIADGKRTSVKVTDLLLSNCGGLARTLHPHPPVIRPDDGKLNLCIAQLRSPLEYPMYYLRRLFLPHATEPTVREMTISHQLVVESPVPLCVQADGDVIGETPITVDLQPGAVQILVP